MDPLEAFKVEQWDCVELTIGRHKVLAFDMETPRESVKRLVWSAGDGRLFLTSASSSYSEVIAERMLDCFNNIDMSSLVPGKVTVAEADFKPSSPFEVLAIAPPELALFDHMSEEVRQRIYLVVPAYRSEFQDGISVKDFKHQMGRKDGWRVHIYRWNRYEKTAPSWD